MSDTLGYGFINPNYIDSLSNELADVKKRVEELEGLLKRCILSGLAKDVEIYGTDTDHVRHRALLSEVRAAL